MALIGGQVHSSQDSDLAVADFALEAAEPHGSMKRWVDLQLRRILGPDAAQQIQQAGPAGSRPVAHSASAPDAQVEEVPTDLQLDTRTGSCSWSEQTAEAEARRLLDAGSPRKALAVMEAHPDGPPDWLLYAVATKDEEAVSRAITKASTEHTAGTAGSWVPAVERGDAQLSWQCVMRLRDKSRAAELIHRLMMCWELQVWRVPSSTVPCSTLRPVASLPVILVVLCIPSAAGSDGRSCPLRLSHANTSQ